MINRLKKTLRHLSNNPDGLRTLNRLGHRNYVGGMWDEIGKLQFELMIRHGLKPNNVLLDIACGSLRGGVHFIKYLEKGGYLGIDREAAVIEAGINEELGFQLLKEKDPQFVVSKTFEFSKFTKAPDMSLAQSLFSHLTPKDIKRCLKNLYFFVEPGHTFLVTFFEGDHTSNPVISLSHAKFSYSKDDLIEIGKQIGWQTEFIGDIGHPRNQVLIKYSK